MYRKLILIFSIFVLSLFIFLPKGKAQTHPCASATSNETLISCYESFHFSNPVWSCVGTDEVQCRKNFGKQVDEKLDEWAPCILGVCMFGDRPKTWNHIMGIFDTKRAEIKDPENEDLLITTPTPTVTPRPTATPTITPTPVENSISLYHDRCKPRINSSNSCLQNLNDQISCYSQFEPIDGIWTCDNLSESQCRDMFINIIKNNMRSITGTDCSEVDYFMPNTSIGVGYAALRQVFNERYGRRTLIEESISVTPLAGFPTPVVTEAVIEGGLVPEDPSNEEVKKAWDVFNCGFANGEDEGKNACCTNTIGDINPDFSPTDNVVETNCNWFTDFLNVCPLPDFSQIAEDKLIDYLDRNQVTASLDELMANEGGVPKCFVGTCGDDNLCHPEEGADICSKYIGDSGAASQCEKCMKGNSDPSNTKKFYTAFGCIDTSFSGIISTLFSLGLGIAGTTTLFCIIYAAFIMQTSQNNPERLQKAQENITACITGLVLIIFSVFILRVIGVDLLRIPGFSASDGTTNEINQSSITIAPTLFPNTPAPTMVLNITNRQTPIYIDPGENYSIPNGHTIINILAISHDRRWLQVEIAPVPPRANNRGYILRNNINYTERILPEL